MQAAAILKKAEELVTGDRAKQHGDKRRNMENIATLWSAWLGVRVTASDVPAMMALMKLARTKGGAVNMDDYVDACGYAAIMGEMDGG